MTLFDTQKILIKSNLSNMFCTLKLEAVHTLITGHEKPYNFRLHHSVMQVKKNPSSLSSWYTNFSNVFAFESLQIVKITITPWIRCSCEQCTCIWILIDVASLFWWLGIPTDVKAECKYEKIDFNSENMRVCTGAPLAGTMHDTNRILH